MTRQSPTSCSRGVCPCEPLTPTLTSSPSRWKLTQSSVLKTVKFMISFTSSMTFPKVTEVKKSPRASGKMKSMTSTLCSTVVTKRKSLKPTSLTSPTSERPPKIVGISSRIKTMTTTSTSPPSTSITKFSTQSCFVFTGRVSIFSLIFLLSTPVFFLF